jgi:hypothetical protein
MPARLKFLGFDFLMDDQVSARFKAEFAFQTIRCPGRLESITLGRISDEGLNSS